LARKLKISRRLEIRAATMANNETRYPAGLRKPIKPSKIKTFEGTATEERVDKYWRKHIKAIADSERAVQESQMLKMGLLLRYYEISTTRDTYLELALALAKRHVPGFRVQERHGERVGAPLLWTPELLGDLLSDVAEIKNNTGIQTDKSAIVFLTSNDKYQPKWSATKKSTSSLPAWRRTLIARLQDAKNLSKIAEKQLSLSRDLLEKSASRVFAAKFRTP
jgi:hypothetical protein